MIAKFVHKNIWRIRHASRGILHAFLNDYSFRLQVIFGTTFIFIFWLCVRPLSESEFFFLTLSWILVLITELQNSSFESALDRVHPELHDRIKESKDMAAGSVLIAGLFAFLVILSIAVSRI